MSPKTAMSSMYALLEVEREPAGVRAREEADDHVDRDGGQADELAEAAEDVGDDEQDAEDDEVVRRGACV